MAARRQYCTCAVLLKLGLTARSGWAGHDLLPCRHRAALLCTLACLQALCALQGPRGQQLARVPGVLEW